MEANVVHCVGCGALNTLEGARFCVQCGARLPVQTEPSEVAPSPAPVDVRFPAPVPGPPPAHPQQPTPESLRMMTGARELAAPSSYSFVGNRSVERPSIHDESYAAQTSGSHAQRLADAVAQASLTQSRSEPRGPTDLGPSERSIESSLHGPEVSKPSHEPLVFAQTISRAASTPVPELATRTLPAIEHVADGVSKPSTEPRVVVKSVPDKAALADTVSVSSLSSSPVDAAEPQASSVPKGEQSRIGSPQRPMYSPIVKKAAASAFGFDAPEDDLSWAPPPSGQEPAVSPLESSPSRSFDSPVVVASPSKSAEATFKQEVNEADIAGLLDDIDAGFDRIVSSPGVDAKVEMTEGESQEVIELFTNIAAGYMRPVRDFMVELGLGEPPREWIDVVKPAVASLGKSGKAMGLSELGAATEVFLEALTSVENSEGTRFTAEHVKELTEAFELLAAELPGAFNLEQERERREPIIVQSLLRQIPDVRKVALDKLYSANLTTLSMYYHAKPYDIAQAAGLSEELAARIVSHFSRYREQTSVVTPDLERSQEHEKLTALMTLLQQQNDDFEAASKSWSAHAMQDKKRLRKERNDTVLEINLLLARLGEVDLVKQIEKLPLHAKVRALQAYLDEHKEHVAADSRR